jgi:putative membrane protein
MKTYFIPIVATAFLLSCGENNKPEDSTEVAEERNDEKFDVMEKDADFAVKAADAGMYEVMIADLALSKTSNPDVKSLANMMKTDHTTANTELQALAKQKNISLPVSMSKDMQDKYDDLNKKTGTDFDKAYCDAMVKDHKDDVDLFEKQSTKGADQDMRSWAASKLPTLRHHLETAESTRDKVK